MIFWGNDANVGVEVRIENMFTRRLGFFLENRQYSIKLIIDVFNIKL